MKRLLFLVLCLASLGVSFGQYGTHWQPVGGFESNMTVEAIVFIDNVEQFSETLELGAFCGDECRGAVLPFEDAGQMWYFLLFGGVNNEQIIFRLYDHATSQELDVECENVLTYVSDGDIDPYNVYFTTPSSDISNTTPGNWSTAGNWQGGVVPGADDAVAIAEDCTLDQDATVASLSIADGKTLTLQAGRTLTVTGDLVNAFESGLVIEDGAQLINASENVAATAEKNIVAYSSANPGWYTISSPVNEMTIAGSDFLSPEYDLFRYNENPDDGLEWENYKANVPGFTTFENGRGYLYANDGTFVPTFVGTLNAAAVTRQLTCTGSETLSGFNLIGNPFPHAIYKGAGGAIDNANLASGYFTLNNDGAWQPHTFDEAIMPGRGILVKAVADIELEIAKSTAEATGETGGAKTAVGRIDVIVKSEYGGDRTFVYLAPGISLEKLGGFSTTTPSLFVRMDHDYAIAHVDATVEAVEVGFVNHHDAEIRLKVSTSGEEFDFLQLVDVVAGTVVDLLEQPEYVFHATGTETVDRFKMAFRMTTGVAETAAEKPFAFVSNGYIIVDGEGALQIIDATGRVIVDRKDATQAVSTNGMVPGVYVLRQISENKVRTQKIVVK